MTEILTVADVDSAVHAVYCALPSLLPNILRIEGFCGSGKTTLSRKLAKQIGAAHVEIDQFAMRYDDPPPYPQCIKLDEANRAIHDALSSNRTVILDAVCLEDVAPSSKWGVGYQVYVKRLSFNATNPAWSEGYNLEDDPPEPEPHRSVHHYHLRCRPHETAQIIIEWPENGHELPKGPFSRERCFDPSST